jgi:hypothetical protein
MARENDLEGQQYMGGKHGDQAGMKPEDRSAAQQASCETKKGRSNRPTRRGRNTSAVKVGTTTRPAIRVRGGAVSALRCHTRLTNKTRRSFERWGYSS